MLVQNKYTSTIDRNSGNGSLDDILDLESIVRYKVIHCLLHCKSFSLTTNSFGISFYSNRYKILDGPFLRNIYTLKVPIL